MAGLEEYYCVACAHKLHGEETCREITGYAGEFSCGCLYSHIGIEIRATHPYGFRYGTWARILNIEWKNNRPCYRVWFSDDSKVDYWPIYDPSDPYEFRPFDIKRFYEPD